MSLYLKYRPSDFDNLVGQDFIKNTLRKAVAVNKTVGAYLLCGPRGTGKTSTARLLAKTINCLNPKDGNPCLECSICKEFSTESLIDIIEIDAASHTGVDNIRELIERAQFLPTKTKYKIYIIDEVHMLSKGAFNALLKILEEPPSHVKFILATTETHKVPETIISRCQRYDFKRISDIDLKFRLSFIAEKENIEVDDRSYNYIIKNSNGGLRNAISLFEQLISDKKILYNDLVDKLGIISDDEIGSFLNKLLEKNSTILSDFDKIVSDGKNVKLFFKELIFLAKNNAIINIRNGENISKYINILEILDDFYIKTKNSVDENTTFTIAILKIIGEGNSISNSFDDRPIQTIEKHKNIEKKESESEISKGDIENIFDFGEQNNFSRVDKLNNDFDSNLFIDKLKNIGAKGALTMALRGSKIYLSDGILNIKSASSITKKNIENTDNFSLMLNVLNEMGFLNIKIKII